MTHDTLNTEYLDRFGRGLCYSLGLFLGHGGEYRRCRAEVELMAAEGAIQFEGKEKKNTEKVHQTLDRLAALRWFTNAALPIRNLTVPAHTNKKQVSETGSTPSFSEDFLRRLHLFKEQCTQWSFPDSNSKDPTSKDVAWAIEEAKELLRLIDGQLGISTIKAQPDTVKDRSPCLIFRDC